MRGKDPVPGNFTITSQDWTSEICSIHTEESLLSTDMYNDVCPAGRDALYEKTRVGKVLTGQLLLKEFSVFI